MSDKDMIVCAPEFDGDAEYHAWLDVIHQEIQDEGEDNAHYREARED